MPNSHSTTDNPKPRVRGDMYLCAEQRRREEEGDGELNGNRTPDADPVYQLEARDTPEPAILAPMVVVVPQMDPAAEPVVVEADPLPEPIVAPALPAVPAPVPMRKTATVPRASRHLPTRRALVPVAALGAVAIAATFGVTLTLSPPKPTELKDSETAERTAPAPETSARPSLPPPETAPPVAPSAAAPVQPPTPAPTRPAVARVARSTSAARAAEGQLRVNSNPPGARVTVNGIGRGQTPLTVTHLSFGTQTVRVTRDGFTSQESVVRVSGDDPEKVLNLTLRARR